MIWNLFFGVLSDQHASWICILCGMGFLDLDLAFLCHDVSKDPGILGWFSRNVGQTQMRSSTSR
jgi:hypothetical protein